MARIEVRNVPWNDGATAEVRVRVWSVRERDAHDRQFGITGEEFSSALVGALSSPQAAGGQKGLQLARTLAEDQRRRFAEQGRESLTAKVATCLAGVRLPDGSEVPFPDAAARLAWVEDLDADVFDRVAAAVDGVLGLRPEAKKK